MEIVSNGGFRSWILQMRYRIQEDVTVTGKALNMTCIAGAIDPTTGAIWMASDSRTSRANVYHDTALPKVFTLEGAGAKWLFGVGGVSLYSQTLQYHMKLPRGTVPRDPAKRFEFLNRKFQPLLRAASLKEEVIKSTDTNVDTGSAVLIGLCGSFYTIDCCLTLCAIRTPYMAVGSGAEVALGNLGAYFSRPNPGLSLHDVVWGAVDLASRHCPGVGGPIHVMSDHEIPA